MPTSAAGMRDWAGSLGTWQAAMDDFRAIALSLPEAVEQDHFGSPSFRVNGKIFAQLSADELEGLCKLPLGVQEQVLLSFPDDSWPALHWGRYGWTCVKWRNLPVALNTDLLTQSWRAVASRMLRETRDATSE